jgi:hypothetical protein
MTNFDQTLSADDARNLARQAAAELRVQWEVAAKPSNTMQVVDSPETVIESIPDDYDPSKIIQVCQYGDLSVLQALIAQGENIHVDEETPLQLLAARGRLDMVQLLLDHGADLHAGADFALRRAAEFGHFEVVQLLLDHGADLHTNDDVALQVAAENGYFEIVRLLLERGADPHTDDDLALQWAAADGHLDVVWLLLDYGAFAEFLTAEQNEAYDLYKQEQFSVRKKSVQAEQNLTEIFNSRIWAGHVPEMLQLWQEIPEALQEVFDFQTVLAQTRHQALKQSKPRITLVR